MIVLVIFIWIKVILTINIEMSDILQSVVIQVDEQNNLPYNLVFNRYTNNSTVQKSKLQNNQNLFLVVAATDLNFVHCLEICIPFQNHICSALILVKKNCSIYNISYDEDAIISNSDQHILTIKEKHIQLYIGYLSTANVTFNFTITADHNECKNNCSNGKDSSRCFLGQCICSENYFGTYCQFKRQILILDMVHTITLRGFSWSYTYLPIQVTNQSQPLTLITYDVLNPVKVAVSSPIPNYYWDSYDLDFKKTESNYLIKKNVIHNELTCGFYNPNFFPLLFYIKFTTQKLQDKKPEYDPFKLSLYVSGVMVLALFLLKVYSLWHQNRILLTRESSRLNRSRRIPKLVKKGFAQDFIIDYFPPLQFNKLVLSYPSLGDMPQCVICLETMKHQVAKGIEDEGSSPIKLSYKMILHEDQSTTIRATSGELYQCSVTPCFHVFHHICLLKWLSRQKNCPICRKEFTEDQIIQKQRWIHIDAEMLKSPQGDKSGSANQDSDRFNQYIQRMKGGKSPKKTQLIPYIMASSQNLQGTQFVTERQLNTNYTNVNLLSQESKHTESPLRQI